jgi:hypothetical protein
MDEEGEMNKQPNFFNKNTNIIIIPAVPGAFCFHPHTYNESLLPELISKKDYDLIVYKASKIMGNSILKKRKFDNFEVSNTMLVLFAVSFILILTFFFLFYSAQGSDGVSAMIVVSLVLLVVGLGIALAQAFYSFCRKTRKYKTLEDIIQEDLTIFFEGINNTYYFVKIRNKFKYNGSLHFVYVPNKKYIKCYISKIEIENGEDILEGGNAHNRNESIDLNGTPGINQDNLRSTAEIRGSHKRQRSAFSMKSKDGRSYLTASEIETVLNG